MATVDDIDTVGAVSKYLSRTVVTSKEDDSADTSEEITALLEAVAVAFLLEPQMALAFILMAKNNLQQIVSADNDVLTYILGALDEIQNPDTPVEDTGSLVAAKTALIEVDRSGKVDTSLPAYNRYQTEVNNFLDNQLATSLKRRRTGELERSGSEAKQDLFSSLYDFLGLHPVMISQFNLLLSSVASFQSVDLTQIVASKTIALVRSSLDKIIQGFNSGILSKTSGAIELLAGSASLSSISNNKGLYDPTVQTGQYPVNRTITVSSEPTAAVASAVLGQLSTTPWTIGIATDVGAPISAEYPATGVSGKAFVISNIDQSSVTLSSNLTLYVDVDGTIVTITLPAGTTPLSTIITDINAVNPIVQATTFQGTNRLLIYSPSGASVTILPAVMGTMNSGNPSNPYVPAASSCHVELGFDPHHGSNTIGVVDQYDFLDFLAANYTSIVTAALVDGEVQITANSTAYTSVLTFTGVMSTLGFANAQSEPQALLLQENGAQVDPSSLNIFVNSEFTVTDALASLLSFNGQQVTELDGNRILFGVTVPRCVNANVLVMAPLVRTVQKMLVTLGPLSGTFDNDVQDMNQALSPLSADSPTQAQISDATNLIKALRTKVQSFLSILQGITVREDQTQFGQDADDLLNSLQERNLDRAIDLLKEGDFVTFFGLTKDTASKAVRFLSAIETVGQADLPSPFTDANDAGKPELLGSNPNNIIPDQELSSS